MCRVHIAQPKGQHQELKRNHTVFGRLFSGRYPHEHVLGRQPGPAWPTGPQPGAQSLKLGSVYDGHFSVCVHAAHGTCVYERVYKLIHGQTRMKCTRSSSVYLRVLACARATR